MKKYKKWIKIVLNFSIILSIIVFIEKPAMSSKRPYRMFEIEKILPKEIGDYRVEGNDEIYDRITSFKYMNGAAELYRSYAFKLLLVRRYAKTGFPTITVEIFDMGLSEEAFGIFSYQTEDEEVKIGQGSGYGGGLLRFWKDKYFINVFSDKETPDIKKDIIAIARAISNNINQIGLKPKLINFLPEENLSERTIRYFHLYPLLNHHYFISHENILNLGTKTNCIFADYSFPESKEKTYLLLIQYPDRYKAQKALKSFLSSYMPEVISSSYKSVKTENGKWTSVKIHQQFIIIVFDSPTLERAERLIETTIKKLKVR